MRLILFFPLLFTLLANGQTKIYDLDKLGSINFANFTAGKKVIVVGEMHGTTEVPLFVLHLVKQLAKAKKQLTVGLEIPNNYQKDIDEFMKNGDIEKLKKLEHFKYPDGRTSIAMGHLINGLRELNGVNVICFDIALNSSPGVNRDSLMGLNLSKSYTGGQMVILTGNLHANLKHGYWRPNFKSATYYLNKDRQFNEALVSLVSYYSGGTIWNCMQDGCKEREAGTNGGDFKQIFGLTNFIGIYEDVHPSGYSGFIYWDKVTASKPLVD